MAQGTWPVNMIAEEKENQLQLLAASRSGKKNQGEREHSQHCNRCKALALRRRQGRSNPGENTNGEQQNSRTQRPVRSG
jgi:hypothetical protein